MIATFNIVSESQWTSPFAMPREKKISKSYRLNPLVVSIIEAEKKERSKGLDKSSKPSDADILEECVYRMAAQNPSYRERIIKELRKDARFAAILDALGAKGENHAKG